MLKSTLSLVVFTAFAASAAAQPAQPAQPTGRVTRQVSTSPDAGYVEINLGMQATSSTFDITTHPLTNVEPATVLTNYNVEGAREFDVGGGVRVGPHLAFGASFSRYQKLGDVKVRAQIPHPFFFDRARTVTGTAEDLSRQETGLHGKVVFIQRVGEGLEILASGGPSFFRVHQDLVENITLNESYPFDTATFASAIAKRHTTSGLGFNVGLDVTRLITSHMGFGGEIVFSRAKLKFDTFADPTRQFDVGGLRVGGGLRFRF
jgi:hypothetical protein